ncbi:MAG: hypothetical protein AAGG68_06245 [Bacteroidota bacterium]
MSQQNNNQNISIKNSKGVQIGNLSIQTNEKGKDESPDENEKKQPASISDFKKIKEAVAKGKLKKTIYLLIKKLDLFEEEHQREILQISSRMSLNEAQNRKNLISSEQYNIETNNIVSAILSIIGEY